MTKKEVRKIFREKRKELTNSEIDKKNDLLLINFQQISLPHLHWVHTYLASESLREPNTSLVVNYLLFKFPELRIAAPKIDAIDIAMHHYEITHLENMEKNTFGIDEPKGGMLVNPKEFDLVIVPMLAFDTNGYRVGYGKGYYDRFLAECRNDTLKIGLSFFEPVSDIEDRDAHDIPLDYCFTPDKIFNW